MFVVRSTKLLAQTPLIIVQVDQQSQQPRNQYSKSVQKGMHTLQRPLAVSLLRLSRMDRVLAFAVELTSDRPTKRIYKPGEGLLGGELSRGFDNDGGDGKDHKDGNGRRWHSHQLQRQSRRSS